MSAKSPFDLMLSLHRHDEIHSAHGLCCPDRIPFSYINAGRTGWLQSLTLRLQTERSHS